MKRALVPCWLFLLPVVVLGGYRTVEPAAEAPARHVDAAKWSARVERADGSERNLKNLGGRFEAFELAALESVSVELTHPDLTAQDSVFAYTVNGGRVHGEIASSLRADREGRLRFAFQAGRYFGDYPVVLRFRASEVVLTFWVSAARLEESE